MFRFVLALVAIVAVALVAAPEAEARVFRSKSVVVNKQVVRGANVANVQVVRGNAFRQQAIVVQNGHFGARAVLVQPQQFVVPQQVIVPNHFGASAFFLNGH